MLDVKPGNLHEEIEEAIRFRRIFTDPAKNLVMAFAGNDYREDWQTEDLHENHAAEYISTFLPQLIDSNPAVYVESDLLDREREQSMRAGLNTWLDRASYVTVGQRTAMNMLLMPFGVQMITLETVPGYGNEEGDPDDALDEDSPWVWPRVHNISPLRYFVDPLATDHDNSRFRGHIWIRDLEDLRKARGPDGKLLFDRSALEQMATDAGVDHLRTEQNMGMNPYSRQRHRNEVVGYEVYVPETRTIYTLGSMIVGGESTTDAVYLRPPRRYRGPRCGPYVMFGIHWPPDQIYPVSPLAISAALTREINAHAGQASDDAGMAKTLHFVDSTNEKVMEAVTSYQNGAVIGVPGFTGQVASTKVGGAQRENLDYISLLRERLDRLSGMSETIRGNIDPDATATAEKIAKQSADVRTRYARAQFQRCVGKVLRIVADQMHDREIVRFPVALVQPGGQKQAYIFQGGSVDPTQRAADMHYKIKPYSMEAVDDVVLQRRMQQVVQTLATILPLGMQMPFLQVREIIDDTFESLNIHEAGDRYIDYELYAMIQQAMMAAPPEGEGENGEGGEREGEVYNPENEMGAIMREQQSLAGAA